MKILLVGGHGRMGRLVASLAGEYGCEVAGIVDVDTGWGAEDAWRGVDVAIDFSTAAAVPTTVETLARQCVNLVIGTTGWQQHEAAVRNIASAAAIGVVAAPNFSTGVVIFEAIVARAATLIGRQAAFGAWIHEAHHAMKKDAPSGTALSLRGAMERAGYPRPIDMSSTRAGQIPGTHTVGFDGPAETITLTHAARDRTTFARGALAAAQWVRGRTGWFTMADVLGLT